MMSDGAHQGYGAEAAVKAVFGSDDPVELETVEEMRDRILAAPRPEPEPEGEGYSYDGTATYLAKIVLTALLADPALASVPTEAVYAHDDESKMVWPAVKIQPSLWDILKERTSPEDYAAVQGFTGFQWGWAVNAARRCVELGPVANPAIIEI
jgi:hypothetical protein